MYSIASSVGSPARRSPVAIVRTLDNSLRQGCLSSSPRPPVCLWSRTCARRGDVCAPLANGTSRARDIPILLWHYEWCSGTSGLVRALVPVDVREGPDDPAGGARRRVSSGSRRAHAQAARTRYLVPAGRSGTCASGHNIVGPCPSPVRARASVEPPPPTCEDSSDAECVRASCRCQTREGFFQLEQWPNSRRDARECAMRRCHARRRRSATCPTRPEGPSSGPRRRTSARRGGSRSFARPQLAPRVFSAGGFTASVRKIFDDGACSERFGARYGSDR